MKSRRHVLLPALLLLLAPRAAAQDGAAPAAEAAIPWQRSLEDALALSRASGKPLLVCVNMDGETASESFARRRYRSAEFVALVEGFVPIVLSPDRHAPLDRDGEGRRVPCPRFGSVVCGEHVAMEPAVYERWFDGRRVAPRHVGVAPGGEKLFDLYLLDDLRRVDEALREHGRPHGGAGEGDFVALLESRDARDRERLERAYLEGEPAQRAQLLRWAEGSGAEPYDLLRLGLAEEDPELRLLAARALAATVRLPAAAILLDELARAAPELREALRPALARLSGDPRAARAARVLDALATPSALVDAAAWRAALEGAEAEPPAPGDLDGLGRRVEELGERADAAPLDPAAELALGWGFFDLAMLQLARGDNPSYSWIDARDAARRAAEEGARPEHAAALEACCDWWLGEADAAFERVAAAVPALLEAPATRASAHTLEVLARSRTARLWRADSAGEPWEAAWLADADAAFRVLAVHPHGTAELACAHADLLRWLELLDEEREALERAVERHPAAGAVHERYRAVVARLDGPPALEAAYAERRAASSDFAAHDWFAGYALLVVAEHHRRAGEDGAADAAYGRALAAFEASIAANADYAATADHYVALALGARARLALARGAPEDAVELLVAAIARRPESADAPDGLGETALETLTRLRRDLLRDGRSELLARLESAVRRVAPELLERAGA